MPTPYIGNTRTSGLKDNLPFWLLVVLCFFPIMRFGVMSVAIIAFCLSCVICYYPSIKDYLNELGWKPFLIQIGFFVLLVLSVSYSENTKNAFVQLQKAIPLAVLPWVFLYAPPRIDRKRLHILFGAFIVANLLFIAYLFQYLVNYATDFAVTTSPGLILFEGLKDQGFLTQLKSLWDASFYETLYYAQQTVESKMYIHKTYASQSLVWCVLLVTYFLFSKGLKRPLKVLLGFLWVLCLVLIVYFYSLANLLLLLVILPAYVFFKLPSKKYRIGFVILLGLLSIALASLINTKKNEIASDSYEAYTQYESPQFVFDNLVKMFANDDRNGINQCNTALISSAPMLGYGFGDVQDKLDACYDDLKKNNLYDLNTAAQNLNPHNYYALLWIAGGILAPLAFLFLLCYGLLIGFRNKDFLYLAFILLVGANLLTESTLSRAYGVLFFALWNGLLFAKNIRSNKNEA
ncbi:MAG: O-antigen ligase family protein [Flavobacteriaceae bacterium]